MSFKLGIVLGLSLALLTPSMAQANDDCSNLISFKAAKEVTDTLRNILVLVRPTEDMGVRDALNNGHDRTNEEVEKLKKAIRPEALKNPSFIKRLREIAEHNGKYESEPVLYNPTREIAWNYLNFLTSKHYDRFGEVAHQTFLDFCNDTPSRASLWSWLFKSNIDALEKFTAKNSEVNVLVDQILDVFKTGQSLTSTQRGLALMQLIVLATSEKELKKMGALPDLVKKFPEALMHWSQQAQSTLSSIAHGAVEAEDGKVIQTLLLDLKALKHTYPQYF